MAHFESHGFVFEVEESTGWVRELRWAGQPLLSAAYAAVRDTHWGTYGVTVGPIEGSGENLNWQVQVPEVGFVWDMRVEVRPGAFSFRVSGACSAPLETQRTGLCVLHPLEGHRGVPVYVEHPDGSEESSSFPHLVAPHQPFRELRALRYALGDVGQVRVAFEGEVFETEDQRNWTDASYKTYCRPLDWPRPYLLEPGERVEHQVTVTVTPDTVPALPDPTPGEHGAPEFGLWLDELPDLETLEQLELLGLGFVAALLPSDPAELLALADPLERSGLGLHLYWPPEADPQSLEVLSGLWLPSTRLMLGFEAWDDAAKARLRAARSWADPRGAQVVACAWRNFTELNRAWPSPGGLDGYGFAANPQVHAFDDRSILETPPVFSDILLTAHARAHGLPIHVGPVSFEPWGREPDARRGQAVGQKYFERVRAVLSQSGAASVVLR